MLIATEIIIGFIKIPSAVNASLGSTSHFTCSVQGGLPRWHIQFVDCMNISLAQREISHTTFGMGGIRTSRLSILASVANNNSAVQCSIDNGITEVIFSPTVLLKVQGMSQYLTLPYIVYTPMLIVCMWLCNFFFYSIFFYTWAKLQNTVLWELPVAEGWNQEFWLELPVLWPIVIPSEHKILSTCTLQSVLTDRYLLAFDIEEPYCMSFRNCCHCAWRN